jgi:hypothetical protein
MKGNDKTLLGYALSRGSTDVLATDTPAPDSAVTSPAVTPQSEVPSLLAGQDSTMIADSVAFTSSASLDTAGADSSTATPPR